MLPTGRILVTGGLGFIGSALAEQLLQCGNQITVVDSLVSNVVEPRFLTDPYPGAAIEIASVEDYFRGNGPATTSFDLAIHAASLVGPAGILAHAGTIGEQIVHSTSQLLHYCKVRQVPLIYFSSAEVYGHSGILDEEMDIRVPCRYNARLEYALGKLTCESMLINSRAAGLQSVIIRPFNVVGPRQGKRGGFVVPTLVQQALAEESLTVFESGQQQRAFTDVDDIVKFVCGYAVKAFSEPTPIYNVGNPSNTTTIEALATRICDLLQSRSPLLFTSGRAVHGPAYCEAESFRKIPQIRRAADLGWHPSCDLDQIILKCADFYRAQSSGAGSNVKRIAA